MTYNPQEGDIVICTVDRIIRTIVFVKIEGNGEGGILFSEIAPGRIRNIRDYVVPKKRIVCKILRVSGDRIDLSLRRVTQKEKKEALERYKQERKYKSILKTILKKDTEKILKEIEKQENIVDFLEEAKDSSKELEKIAGKENSEKILEILKKEKPKTAIIKKEFSFTSSNPEGLSLIKKILGKIKNTEIKYISAGKYSIKSEAPDPKSADKIIQENFNEIEKQAKKQHAEFSIKEK